MFRSFRNGMSTGFNRDHCHKWEWNGETSLTIKPHESHSFVKFACQSCGQFSITTTVKISPPRPPKTWAKLTSWTNLPKSGSFQVQNPICFNTSWCDPTSQSKNAGSRWGNASLQKCTESDCHGPRPNYITKPLWVVMLCLFPAPKNHQQVCKSPIRLYWIPRKNK